jgi:hypothetical protein
MYYIIYDPKSLISMHVSIYKSICIYTFAYTYTRTICTYKYTWICMYSHCIYRWICIYLIHIVQLNKNIYIEEYVGMLVCKDKYPCMYAYTDKWIYTWEDKQVSSENIL